MQRIVRTKDPIAAYALLIRRLTGKAASRKLIRRVLQARTDGLRYVARMLFPTPYVNRSDNTIRFAVKVK